MIKHRSLYIYFLKPETYIATLVLIYFTVTFSHNFGGIIRSNILCVGLSMSKLNLLNSSHIITPNFCGIYI